MHIDSAKHADLANAIAVMLEDDQQDLRCQEYLDALGEENDLDFLADLINDCDHWDYDDYERQEEEWQNRYRFHYSPGIEELIVD